MNPHDQEQNNPQKSGITEAGTTSARQRVQSKTEELNFETMSRGEIVKELKRYIHDIPLEAHKNEVDLLVKAFYKKKAEEEVLLRQQLVDEGGLEADFVPPQDEWEKELKKWTAKYQTLKEEYFVRFEKEKKDNLAQKNAIIEKIKELVHGEESLHKTFDDFRLLQQQWREIGEVERAEQRLLYQNYNHAREMFYDYVKLNKELKDDDLKRNYDIKIKLCDKAKELLNVADVFEAYRELQQLHDQWREIGPVEPESKEDLWDRFKESSREINKNHRAAIVELQRKRKENVRTKTLIAQQILDLAAPDYKNVKEWQEKADEVMSLQKQYREAGPVPKRNAETLAGDYRKACDLFFEKRKSFFAQHKESLRKNLASKQELLEKAEALKDSKEWDQTAKALIELQKKWKEIGPVPRSHSDKIWKQFRAACNTFFDARAMNLSGEDGSFDENLKLKQTVLQELSNFEYADHAQEDMKKLLDIQNRWGAIGFVPRNKKQEIEEQYQQCVKAITEKLQVKPVQKEVMQYTARIASLGGKPGTGQKMKGEYEKLQKKMRGLQEEVKVLDNNLGFFKNSKNASGMIADFQQQIDQKKEEISLTKRKMDALNRME